MHVCLGRTISLKWSTEAFQDQFPWQQIRLLSQFLLNDHEGKHLSQKPATNTDMTGELHNHALSMRTDSESLRSDDSCVWTSRSEEWMESKNILSSFAINHLTHRWSLMGVTRLWNNLMEAENLYRLLLSQTITHSCTLLKCRPHFCCCWCSLNQCWPHCILKMDLATMMSAIGLWSPIFKL